MSELIYELLFAYAQVGVQAWQSESRQVKQKARLIGVRIAEHVGLARQVVAKPFNPSAGNGGEMILIPMPCRQRRVFAAFFAPWLSSQGWQYLSFDLVVLLAHGSAIAFRFEPAARRGNGTHGYDHVQLNEMLGQRQVELGGAVAPLPTTYPAFPVRSQDALTRVLAMMVAMHGFPNGVDDVFDRAFRGQARTRKKYLDMTKTMLK